MPIFYKIIYGKKQRPVKKVKAYGKGENTSAQKKFLRFFLFIIKVRIIAQRQKNVIKNDCFFLCLRIYLYPRVGNTRQVLLNGTLSVNEGITAVCFCVRFAFFCEKFFNSSEKSNVLRALLKGAFFMKNFNVKNLFFSSAFLNAGKA